MTSLLYRRLVSVGRRLPCIPESSNQFSAFHSIRTLTVTPVLLKVRKNDKKKQHDPAGNIVHAAHAHNALVDTAMKEMETLEQQLDDELVKHFSTKVDLRVYEEVMVKLENGTTMPMNRLGRVVLKSPQMIMIQFINNPTAIKPAKLALQKSHLAVNPQQDGVVLYVPVPRMTRERREELAQSAKTTIFNDYKDALNKIYIKFDKKSNVANAKNPDALTTTRNLLLSTKRAMEQRGSDKVTAQRKALMEEVA